MGKVLSSISHPFKNFNLESRAHKVISQAKPIAAPKHEKDKIDLERLMKEYPKAYEESLQKNKELDSYLKDVYVTSHDPNIKQKASEIRPLPLNRKPVEDFLYGIKEPKKIPLGKTTLAKALEFISKHQNEPQVYNSKKIAEEYFIPEVAAGNILKYFRVFEVYVPVEGKTKAKFAGPSTARVYVIKQLRKELPPGPKSNEKT